MGAGDGAAVLTVPLLRGAEAVGQLCLGPKVSGEAFRPEDCTFLMALGSRVAEAIYSLRLAADLDVKARLLETQRAALDRLNERLLRTREEERALLAADLHDEPLQTVVRLHNALVAADPARTRLGEEIALAGQAIEQLRAACRVLRPALLDDLGLPAALDALAQETEAQTGTPVILQVEITGALAALPSDAALVPYRTAHEALANCVRHARPRSIMLILDAIGPSIRLTVSDDGAGFAVPACLAALTGEGHFGLAGMQTRVRHAGGTLQVTSDPGRGPRLTATLPLPREVAV